MSHRREQLESSLKRVIGKILAQGLHDPRISGLVSIVDVQVTADGHTAVVGVSVLPAEREKATLAGLRHAARHIKVLAYEQLKVRQMPELQFRLDTSLKKQAEVLAAIDEAMQHEKETERDEAEPGPADGKESQEGGSEPNERSEDSFP